MVQLVTWDECDSSLPSILGAGCDGAGTGCFAVDTSNKGAY